MNNAVGSYVAQGAFNITPSATHLSQRAYTLRIGGEGSLDIICEDGETVHYDTVFPGESIPIIVTHVLETSTATNIVGYKMFTDIRG